MHDYDARAQTPSEADQILGAVAGDILMEDDPVVRYMKLTEKLTVLDRVVGRLADERARCAAELSVAGKTLSGIAEEIGGTRSRAQQLVERGRGLTDLVFAFRDETGEFHGDLKQFTMKIPYEAALLRFNPANPTLRFAGQLLRVYFAAIDEERNVLPSMYVHDLTTGTARRVRPSREVFQVLFEADPDHWPYRAA